MPALGGGYALLKWVTSFPGNPRPWAADRVRAGAPLERGDRRAARGARRSRGHGVARRQRACRGRDARPLFGTVAVIGCGVNGAGNRGACWPRLGLRTPRLRS